MIPKIIWQTHNYKYNNLPKSLLKASKTWQYLNADWDYRYVDNIERDMFVKQEDEEIYNLYKKSRPMAQSDIWRMLVIYKYGGVYADMDTACTKPLNYMLQRYNEEDFISEKEHNGSVNIALFAAIKKSVTLKNIIKSVKNETVLDIDWHTWIKFNQHIRDLNTGYFDAAMHAGNLKEEFFDFDIDLYGKKMLYSLYLKDYLKLEEKELLESLP